MTKKNINLFILLTIFILFYVFSDTAYAEIPPSVQPLVQQYYDFQKTIKSSYTETQASVDKERSSLPTFFSLTNLPSGQTPTDAQINAAKQELASWMASYPPSLLVKEEISTTPSGFTMIQNAGGIEGQTVINENNGVKRVTDPQGNTKIYDSSGKDITSDYATIQRLAGGNVSSVLIYPNKNTQLFPEIKSAQNQTQQPSQQICDPNGTCVYTMMAPIPGLLGTESRDSSGNVVYTYTIKRADNNALSSLLNSWFKIGIALAGLLAVVQIVIGGIQYATTDAMSTRYDGKERIMGALQGLILALVSYLILYTINPILTNSSFGVAPIQLLSPTYQAQLGALSVVNPALGGMLTASYSALGAAGFPQQAWNDYALQQVQAAGLSNLTPADAAKYFPDGQPTDQGWVNLLAKIAQKESGFNPQDSMLDVNNTNSVGLLSLSANDPEVRALGYTEADLKDPYKNLQAGIAIMKRTIQNGGVISGQDSSGRWIGATSYWSTLRNGQLQSNP
jgi:hypothetical protein